MRAGGAGRGSALGGAETDIGRPYVRKSTSYYENLERLNERFRKEGKAPVRLRLAPEDLQDDDLLEMLNAGLVRILIMDGPVAKFWSQFFPKIRWHPDVAVSKRGHTAWLMRKNSPPLRGETPKTRNREGGNTGSR